MALHFSADQYNKAFDPKLLQNWEVPAQHRARPNAYTGFTQIKANDRGHLLPGVKRSRESPWGTYVGTWDLPLKIPGNNMTNKTARTFEAVQRLDRCKTDGEIILKGKLKKTKIPDALPVKIDEKADAEVIPAAPQVMAKDGSPRSGAINPEPISISPKDIVYSPKPGTPSINWPKPGSRAQSAAPRLTSPGTGRLLTPQRVITPVPQTNAAMAGTQEPRVLSPSATTINWPRPCSIEAPVLPPGN
ncbi:protein Flattop homolog [Ylistrum balloti]|uniref:protein Flattop homolog n=1 Tax=Ylistrum balloti TaxID=509963 RepID=UPI002905A406|nr:protein Flattop homolog [Ylistrum balloti]